MSRDLSTDSDPSNSSSNQEFLNDYIEWVLTKKIWKEMINANPPIESDYATLVKPKDLGATGLSQEDKDTIKYMGGIQLYKFSSDAMCIASTGCNNSIELVLDTYLSHYTPLSFVQDEPVKIWKGVNVLPSGINAPFTKKLVYSFNMPRGTLWYGSSVETLTFMQSKTTYPYFLQTNPTSHNPHHSHRQNGRSSLMRVHHLIYQMSQGSFLDCWNRRSFLPISPENSFVTAWRVRRT